MNKSEVCFRNEVIKPKKRAKALFDYITFLLGNDHIIEANYYLNLLLEIKPRHEKSLVLGYKIAIKMFDDKRTLHFDTALWKANANHELIRYLQLEYYCSINSIRNIELCLVWFVEQKNIDDEYIELVIESSVIVRELTYIVKLLEIMKKKNIEPSAYVKNIYKKMALEKLVKTISMVRS